MCDVSYVMCHVSFEGVEIITIHGYFFFFGRFDRSRGRSIESIGSVGSVILLIFRFFWHVGELEICLVSKFQLCTTLGGQKK